MVMPKQIETFASDKFTILNLNKGQTLIVDPAGPENASDTSFLFVESERQDTKKTY